MKARFIKNRKNLNEYGTFKQLGLSLMLAASLFVTSSLAADARYRVKSSDNLDRIVSRHYINSDLTKSQLMVAILARNPRAFKGGNINYLMRGRRLVLPSEENLQIVTEDKAKVILKEHATYYRQGITGNFSLSEYGPISSGDENIKSNEQSEYKLSSNDLEQLNSQYLIQQKKLKEVEAEREKLRNQLNKLTEEKKQSDAQLEKLEVKLIENTESQKGLIDKRAKLNVESERSQHKPILSTENKSRLLEEKINERTQDLKDSNESLYKELHETKSELAENTRENIALERQLGQLKSSNQKGINQKSAKQNDLDVTNIKNEQSNNQKEISRKERSVATEIGEAKHTTKSLDSTGSTWSRFAWLLPVLALFAGLWFLLRYFLGGRHSGSAEKDSEIYATPAFEMGESGVFDEDYEEASLETSIKLDVARAYIEADDLTAANEMLQEVIDEGSVEQQQEAIELMSKFQA